MPSFKGLREKKIKFSCNTFWKKTSDNGKSCTILRKQDLENGRNSYLPVSLDNVCPHYTYPIHKTTLFPIFYRQTIKAVTGQGFGHMFSQFLVDVRHTLLNRMQQSYHAGMIGWMNSSTFSCSIDFSLKIGIRQFWRYRKTASVMSVTQALLLVILLKFWTVIHHLPYSFYNMYTFQSCWLSCRDFWTANLETIL